MLYTRFIDDSSDKRAIQHNAGIGLLQKGMKEEYGLEISEKDIIRSDFGKPFFKNYPHIFFSISHCEGLAVCLISNSNCGVDAERIRPVRDGVVRRVFSQDEKEWLYSRQGNERDIFFTSLWTLKEAFAKTDGRGISVMGNIGFFGDGKTICSSAEGYFFRQFFDGKYIISVCTEEKSDIECGEIKLYYPF